MAKPQYLTIAEAERDQSEGLWIVNTSAISDAETFGDVMFNVPKLSGTGDPDRIKVAMTWLPQDLNEQVAKEQILKSVGFRQAVTKNVIAIVTQQYAMAVLRTAEARSERRRLDDQHKMISRSANTTRTLADSGTEVYNSQDFDQRRHGNGRITDGREVLAGSQGHIKYGVSEAFYQFVSRLDGLSDGQAMNEVRARPQLKRSELRCIAAHLGQDQPTTRDHITGRLARLDAKKATKKR